ncbi:MAG: hypothetical protein COB90_05660 [Hyphomicrobiales bacterium]|nr:MAG: hypothetical protein COB90_05660 [Hyphomicrobiales bacterium]
MTYLRMPELVFRLPGNFRTRILQPTRSVQDHIIGVLLNPPGSMETGKKGKPGVNALSLCGQILPIHPDIQRQNLQSLIKSFDV